MGRRLKTASKAAVSLLVLLVFFAALCLGGCAPAEDSAAQSGSAASSTASSNSGGEAGEGEGGEGDPQPPEGSLYAPETEPQATGVCLMNVETGLFIYEKNPDTPVPAGSLVKMMTCMLAMDRFGDALDDTLVSANKVWIFDELYGKNASTADIRPGETLSVRELLYACLLPSANEAALMLADKVSGGYMPNFLYMMNMRAKTLGCTGTHFADANGLSEESVTTARDMALIMQAFLGYPVLMEIAATTTYQMAAHEQHAEPYYIHTTNRLLVGGSPYAAAMGSYGGALLGGKTGSLSTEWQNFVSAASHGGATYVCAVLYSPAPADSIGPTLDPMQARPALVEAAALYVWAFSSLEVRGVLDAAQPATEIRVRYSTEQGSVRLMPADDLKAVMKKEASATEVQRRYDLPEYLAAPVEAGQLVGTVTLFIGGQEIGSTLLSAERSVSRNGVLYLWQRAGEGLRSTFFRVLLVLVILAVGLYVALVAWLGYNKRRKGPGGRKG